MVVWESTSVALQVMTACRRRKKGFTHTFNAENEREFPEDEEGSPACAAVAASSQTKEYTCGTAFFHTNMQTHLDALRDVLVAAHMLTRIGLNLVSMHFLPHLSHVYYYAHLDALRDVLIASHMLSHQQCGGAVRESLALDIS